MSDIVQPEKRSAPLLGLWLVLVKVGGKILPVLLKLLKALKVGKVAMLGASFAAYAVLFTWQFAVVLLVSLFIHECGHIWSMKRNGLRTKGVYFIPLLGAAAVSEDAFPSRKAEVEIALMGPLWGFGLALATFGLYLATGSVLIASLAGWMAMLNLFNLLPINPLDGGRVVKSIAYSIHSKAGFWFLVAGFVGCYFLASKFGLGLITFLMVIGALEMLSEMKKMRQARDRKAIFARLDCMATFAPEIADRKAAVIEGIRRACMTPYDRATNELLPDFTDADVEKVNRRTAELSETAVEVNEDRLSPEIRGLFRKYLGSRGLETPDASMTWRALDGVPTYALRQVVCTVAQDACALRKTWFTRKVVADTTFFGTYGLIEVLQTRDMPTMTPRETGMSFLAYATLAVLLGALMFAVQHIPAAGAALQVFIG